MSKNDKKGGLNVTIPAMTCGPLLLFGILAMIFCSVRFTSAMYEKVEEELKEIASGVLINYDLLYPGDYALVKRGNVVAYFKGENEITGNNDIVDYFKDKTGAEVSVFYRDTRMITTLSDEKGERLVGSGANTVIQQAVVEGKESRFYKQVNIYGIDYYAYYEPILTDSGGCVGMIAVAKGCDEIDALVVKSILPMIVIIAIAMVVAAAVSYAYASNLAGAIGKVDDALSKVTKGDLSQEVDYRLLKRNDELSDIGKSIQKMQKSLHILVEKDALTELYNRRLASKRLAKIVKDSKNYGVEFCVALGDIDFFKKVNDTYSHEMGDVVLKEVAKTLKNGMIGKGFVSRWGGEEFLIVFEGMNLEKSKACMESLLDDIRALRIENRFDKTEKEMFGEFVGNPEADEKSPAEEKDAKETFEAKEPKVLKEDKKEYDRYAPVNRAEASQIIKITMTFGLVKGGDDRDKDTLVHMADENLYYGKEHGRNQLVTEEIVSEDDTTEIDGNGN